MQRVYWCLLCILFYPCANAGEMVTVVFTCSTLAKSELTEGFYLLKLPSNYMADGLQNGQLLLKPRCSMSISSCCQWKLKKAISLTTNDLSLSYDGHNQCQYHEATTTCPQFNITIKDKHEFVYVISIIYNCYLTQIYLFVVKTSSWSIYHFY